MGIDERSSQPKLDFLDRCYTLIRIALVSWMIRFDSAGVSGMRLTDIPVTRIIGPKNPPPGSGICCSVPAGLCSSSLDDYHFHTACHLMEGLKTPAYLTI